MSILSAKRANSVSPGRTGMALSLFRVNIYRWAPSARRGTHQDQTETMTVDKQTDSVRSRASRSCLPAVGGLLRMPRQRELPRRSRNFAGAASIISPRHQARIRLKKKRIMAPRKWRRIWIEWILMPMIVKTWLYEGHRASSLVTLRSDLEILNVLTYLIFKPFCKSAI